MSTKITSEELLAAIHKHCLSCSGGSKKEMQNCRIRGCSLWPYRTETGRVQEKPMKGQVTLFEMMKEEKALL